MEANRDLRQQWSGRGVPIKPREDGKKKTTLLLDRFQSPAVSANHTVTPLTPLISAALSSPTHHSTLHLSPHHRLGCYLSLWRKRRRRRRLVTR
ncbi:hypothetical protein EYF80_025874 [Liparis tanakae]|uniref:Uncharacterized protein n=1 Tax=Liparis tanakae TaxID=230148 RepID=A0A4Z2HEA4_9TELE|nr:hypothetical protein EYF80_025874 [Liparis tanakae]